MSEILRHRQLRAQGFVQCFVVDAATKQVVREYPVQKNLILNQGMDALASQLYADCMAYCSAGTGVTPTSDDSGVTTAAQSGTTVNLSGGSFTFTNTGTDAGNTIKWDSGQEAMVVTVVTPTQVTVDRSQTVGAGQFTVYRTNQTQLSSQQKRTSTYLTGSPYCSTVLALNTLKLRRTFDFTSEVGTVNYGEVALGWSNTGATNIFSRILLASVVPVASGQQLRVTYELQITVTPLAPYTKSAVVNGWPVAPATDTNGTEAIQYLGLSSVRSSDGSTTIYDGGWYAGEPSSSTGGIPVGIFVSPDASAPASFGSSVDRFSGSTVLLATPASYIPGTWYMDRSVTFAVGQANSTTIRSMGMGTEYSASSIHAAQATVDVFVFDQAQTKVNTHTLTLTWRTSWSRVLS